MIHAVFTFRCVLRLNSSSKKVAINKNTGHIFIDRCSSSWHSRECHVRRWHSCSWSDDNVDDGTEWDSNTVGGVGGDADTGSSDAGVGWVNDIDGSVFHPADVNAGVCWVDDIDSSVGEPADVKGSVGWVDDGNGCISWVANSVAGAVGVYDGDASVDKVILGGGNGDACIKYTTQYSMEFVNDWCTMITNADATELQKICLLDNFVTSDEIFVRNLAKQSITHSIN